MSYRIPRPEGPYTDPRIIEARERVKAACDANGIPFLEAASPGTVRQAIDEGVRVIAGRAEDTARVGREYSGRTLPV